MITRIRVIYSQLKEIILFIPTIYKARRWDYSSLFLIMSHWLGRIEDCLNTDPYHRDSKKYATEVKVCRLLLNRLYNQHYNDFDEITKKWGDYIFIETDYIYNGEPTYTSKPSKVVTEEDKQSYRRDLKEIFARDEQLYKQDLNMCFDIIKKKHKRWWT